jgi:hypothetical protein
MKMQPTMTVVCLVFPTGETFFSDKCDAQSISGYIDEWRARNPDKGKELDAAGACGGVVIVRMRPEDYYALPAHSNGLWRQAKEQSDANR